MDAKPILVEIARALKEVDFDFLFRKTPPNLADGLQLDFMGTIHGIRSFDGLRARARVIEIDSVPVIVASLADIVKSKRAAGRPRDAAALEILEKALEATEAHPKTTPRGARTESERALRDMIRRWQALPPARRTNFLRKRIAWCLTAA